jgi:protein TonB
MTHRSESELILDNIVFEDRNKEYGAFSIRKSYNSHLKISILIAAAIFCAAIILPVLASLFKKQEVKEEFVMKEVVLTEPPPLDETKPPPPPTPPPPPPPVEPPKVATTKFLPPKIMEDEKVQVEEPPPRVDSIKGNTAAVTQEGDDLLNAPVDIVGNEEVGEVSEEPVLWVAEKPTFEGDYVKFLQQNIKFPAQAANNNISGRVVVEYVLEKDGTISNVKVLKGIGYGCDEEAVRVVKLMSGKWTPGKNNGHSVKFKTMIPILFKLPED